MCQFASTFSKYRVHNFCNEGTDEQTGKKHIVSGLSRLSVYTRVNGDPQRVAHLKTAKLMNGDGEEMEVTSWRNWISSQCV